MVSGFTMTENVSISYLDLRVIKILENFAREMTIKFWGVLSFLVQKVNSRMTDLTSPLFTACFFLCILFLNS